MNLTGPWGIAETESFLSSQRIPMRLSVVGASGYPIVTSVWYLWADMALWCATSSRSRLAQALRQKPECGFEIAGDNPPYMGVRGQGAAILSQDHNLELLRRLLERYFGDNESSLAKWLLGREEDELSIQIIPERLMTWDYSKRMTDVSIRG
jgi:nitroimidazol reductase NimA-like FMN-containing flavoprotein (pyridoxamine 5'-phosphate oxidase superfamily)